MPVGDDGKSTLADFITEDTSVSYRAIADTELKDRNLASAENSHSPEEKVQAPVWAGP